MTSAKKSATKREDDDEEGDDEDNDEVDDDSLLRDVDSSLMPSICPSGGRVAHDMGP